MTYTPNNPVNNVLDNPVNNVLNNPGALAVAPRELQKAIADLHAISPWPALVRTAIHVLSVGFLFWAAWQAESQLAFVILSVLGGFAYATMFMTTHDAIHTTYTGVKWFDEIFPRLISAPWLWFHGVYSEIHKLHHKMNGTDLLDPERVQWTREEYENAGPLQQWYARHQIPVRIFVFGAFGLIAELLLQAIRFYPKSKGLRVQLWTDLALIVISNVVIYGIAISHGVGLKYLLFYLINERIVGAVMQFRAQIEHYGLWGKHANYFDTQLKNCRNIQTNRFVSWYFNHLNFHSVHHAFPTVPFYNLEEAHHRLQGIMTGVQQPLVEDKSYFKTMARLIKVPRFI